MAKQVILLVEDDPADEELTIHALEENNIGNDVVVARDGEEALDYLLHGSISDRHGLWPTDHHDGQRNACRSV